MLGACLLKVSIESRMSPNILRYLFSGTDVLSSGLFTSAIHVVNSVADDGGFPLLGL